MIKHIVNKLVNLFNGYTEIPCTNLVTLLLVFQSLKLYQKEDSFDSLLLSYQGSPVSPIPHSVMSCQDQYNSRAY